MTWKEKTIIRILLIIAQMMSDEKTTKQIHELHCHISTFKD